ncbi:type II secretion system protein [bacterium]|nr:type II secretion system protein [bacterium]
MNIEDKKVAFTLAEVLITLGIIGIVAAMTLPALITNIQDKVKSARIQNVKQKFSKATDKMLSVSDMNGYASTEAFVTELQHHLKLAKICDNSHLQECWPTEKVIVSDDGEEWEISKTKTAKQLIMSNNDTSEWDDTMGIVTADGTAMILSYNKKCDIDINKPVVWSNDSSSSSSCVAAVFDWNGAKKPNKLKDDVIAFNSGGLGRCAFKLSGKCFSAPKLVSSPITRGECNSMQYKLGLSSCTDGLYGSGTYGIDYYASAAKECGGKSKLPSSSDIDVIRSYIYGNKNDATDPAVQARFAELGLSSSSSVFINGTEYRGDAPMVSGIYPPDQFIFSTGTLRGYAANVLVMCLVD